MVAELITFEGNFGDKSGWTKLEDGSQDFWIYELCHCDSSASSLDGVSEHQQGSARLVKDKHKNITILTGLRLVYSQIQPVSGDLYT